MPSITFEFLELPPELRNKIYSLVLPGDQHYFLAWTQNLYHVKHQQYPDHGCPALLSTCRQIYEEAVAFLYSSNIFCVVQGQIVVSNKVTARTQVCTTTTPPQIMSHIRRLELQWRFKRLPITETEMRMTDPEIPLERQITWPKLCSTVAKEMTGLRVLFVRIEVQEHLKWNVGDEMPWVAPMLWIRGLQTCKVFLKSPHDPNLPSAVVKSSFNPKPPLIIVLEDLGDDICMSSLDASTMRTIQKPLASYPGATRAWIS